jgi:hypothetical protein
MLKIEDEDQAPTPRMLEEAGPVKKYGENVTRMSKGIELSILVTRTVSGEFDNPCGAL